MVDSNKRHAALSLLFDQKEWAVEDVKFFLGDDNSAPEDAVWGQIHSALIQERMGKATISTTFDDTVRLVDAEKFLAAI